MDGNRRFGKKQEITEKDSYLLGLEKAIEIAIFIEKMKFKYMSLYVFSKDNNKRNVSISNMINEKRMYDFSTMFKLIFIGDINNLEPNIIRLINNIKEHNLEQNHINNLTIYLFVNYSAKYDLEYTVKNILSSEVQPKNFEEIMQYSLLKNITNIDILIRTGKHQRISNFAVNLLLYSEMYFSQSLWSDLSIVELSNILTIHKKEHFSNYGM